MKRISLFWTLIFSVIVANAQWQHTNLDSNSVTAVSVQCIIINGSNIFAGTNAGVFLSSDNGSNWRAVNNGLTNTAYVTAFTINSGIIFAGMYGNGIFYSSNNGGKWASANTGLTNYNVQALITKGDTIFAGTYSGSGVYMSANNGSNWVAAKTGLTDTLVNALAFKGDTLLAGTDNGIYTSLNKGIQWSLDTGNIQVNAFAVNGNNIFAGTSSGVYLYSSNETKWTAINNSLADTYISALTISGNNILSGSGDGIYISSNNGSAWIASNTGLLNSDVLALAANGTYVFAGTMGGGVWRLPLNEMGLKEINNESHIVVYPNPASGKIKVISNQLSVNSVEIYNLIGEIIYSLLLSDNLSPITINLADLPDGLYILKIKTEKGIAVNKFVKE